jgi:hypothetical protein
MEAVGEISMQAITGMALLVFTKDAAGAGAVIERLRGMEVLTSMTAADTLGDPEFDAVAPLYPPQFADFMAGVSDTTKELLRVWAQHSDGRPSWSDLMKAAGYPRWQQLRGFFGGLTKRIRTVTGDAKANFYDIGDGPMINDSANGEWEDNPIFAHPVTLNSMRRYFGLD